LNYFPPHEHLDPDGSPRRLGRESDFPDNFSAGSINP